VGVKIALGAGVAAAHDHWCRTAAPLRARAAAPLSPDAQSQSGLKTTQPRSVARA